MKLTVQQAELHLISAPSQREKKSRQLSRFFGKKTKKWAWMPEAVEVLLKYIKEHKTKCRFNRVDFEADPSGMYTEVCRGFAVDFSHDFGPDPCHDPG